MCCFSKSELPHPASGILQEKGKKLLPGGRPGVRAENVILYLCQ